MQTSENTPSRSSLHRGLSTFTLPQDLRRPAARNGAHRFLKAVGVQRCADPLEAQSLCQRDRSGVARVHLCHNQDARYLAECVKGAFCEIRQFGKLGALRLTLARENGVDYMINKVIVEPLSLTLNALSPETQPLGYGAALLVFGCARDDYPVQAELPKGMLH
jgi:hypothetical protein